MLSIQPETEVRGISLQTSDDRGRGPGRMFTIDTASLTLRMRIID